MLRSSSAEAAAIFSEMSDGPKVAPLGVFPVTLRAVGNEDRIRGQGRIRRRRLAVGCSEREEEEGTHGDGELRRFHFEPHRDRLGQGTWMR